MKELKEEVQEVGEILDNDKNQSDPPPDPTGTTGL